MRRAPALSIGIALLLAINAFFPATAQVNPEALEPITADNADRVEQLTVLRVHTDFVMSVAFSPDGTLLASSSRNTTRHTGRLWDIATGEEHTVLEHGLPYYSGGNTVAFSPDGTTLAIAGEDDEVWLWDTATEQERAVLQGVYMTDLTFSPDGATLATSSIDSWAVQLWDTVTWQERAVLPGDTGAVRSVAFSPDGTLLASASYGSICLWGVRAGS